MPEKPVMISIPQPLRDRIRGVQDRLRRQLGRPVSVSQAIEHLADVEERTRQEAVTGD